MSQFKCVACGSESFESGTVNAKGLTPVVVTADKLAMEEVVRRWHPGPLPRLPHLRLRAYPRRHR